MIANLPTKSDLLQSSKVDIDHHHKKVITNTLQIADYFGKRASNVNQRIGSLSKRGRLKIKPSYYLNQQSKPQKYYELNRDQFLLVALGFTGDKADQLKADFIKSFNQNETELQQWRSERLDVTDITKQANDQVYLLKAALSEIIPTSRRCTMLFNHIQIAINKVVTGIGKPVDRNSLTVEQLNHIEQLEQLVQIEIEQLRLAGVEPEQVRNDVLTMIKAADKKEALTTSDQTNEKDFHNAVQ